MDDHDWRDVPTPSLRRVIGGSGSPVSNAEIEQMQLRGTGFDHCREQTRIVNGSTERRFITEPYGLTPAEWWPFCAFLWRYGLTASVSATAQHNPGACVCIVLARDKSAEATQRRSLALKGKPIACPF